ncbi:aspartate carbamoyltransferase regulatory subunit [Candidatus Woesearchaeota archaeon]|nr:aspartate carbamoyltransferase regulatory subunit [Candidatus Woesearchaeota archaeon]
MTTKQKNHKKPAKKASPRNWQAPTKPSSGVQNKEIRITAIKDGTVIDHVPAAKVFDVVEILNLKSHKDVVSIATNLDSKKIGKKGILKVAGRELTKKEVDEISVVAPQATINIIKDFKVKEKSKVEVPQQLTAVFRCSNPKCITNLQPIATSFSIIAKNPVKALCFYCERVMGAEEIQLR